MSTKKANIQKKERKIFLSCMNSWFSNFIIEEFRTDYLPDAKIQNTFMGTINISGQPLPRLFDPKEITIEVGHNYNQEVFNNDIFIFNLDDSNLTEVEFVIRGLKNIKYENEKMLILISNIMTWAKTPLKTFTEEEKNAPNFNEEEVPEVKEEEIIVEKVKEIPHVEEKPIPEEKEKENKEKEKEIKDKKTSKSKKLAHKSTKTGKKTKGKEEKKVGSKEKSDKKGKKKDDKKKEKEKKEEKEKEKEKELLEKKNEDLKISEIKGEIINLDNLNNLNNLNTLQEQNEPEKKENKIITYYYHESEYQKRIPNSHYISYKILENLALSNTNPMLNVYVVCPGFIYGCGEDFFFDYFRKSWIGGIKYIPIVGEGMNFIPTIHIKDLIQIIRRLIERKPIINYIFACDKTKNPTMKNIIKAISKGIGSIDIKNLTDFDIDEIDVPNFNELSIDLRIKSSSVTNDEINNVKNKFPWHCEKGIPENMDILRQEFNIYRGIKPIKIIITGPPSAGKSYIAEKISKQFKITHLTMLDIVEWAKNLKNFLGEETRKNLKEIEEKIAIAADEYEHRKNKKKSDPPFDPAPYKKFSSEFTGKLLKEKLGKGECAGKGYILDNYPKTYMDCVNIFAKNIKKKIIENEEENITNNSNTHNTNTKNNNNNVENKQKFEIEYQVIESLLPDSVIIINNFTEESLKNKLMKDPNYEEKQPEMDLRFQRRLKLYIENNQKSDLTPKILDNFYTENNIEIHYLDETEFMKNKEIEFIKLLEYLERYGNIDNFSKLQDEEEILPFKEQDVDIDEEEKILMDDGTNDEIDKNIDGVTQSEIDINLFKTQNKIKERNVDDDISGIDEIENNLKEKTTLKKELRKDKRDEKKSIDERFNKQMQVEKNIQHKLGELKEKEKKLLERKSEVLRRYLSVKVMPLLAKGILSICETRPEDPVEALANFLLDNSFDLDKNNNKITNESVDSNN